MSRGTHRRLTYSGGLREIAEHLFTWGGEVRIDGPEELRTMMRDRLELSAAAIGLLSVPLPKVSDEQHL